jgi:hypothetical protein
VVRTKGASVVFVFAAAPFALAGVPACSSVLGLDPPSLDPCQGAIGCSEGGTTLLDVYAPPIDQGTDAGPTGSDATSDAVTDAAPVPDVVDDRGPVMGTRCGDVSMALGCTGSTPVCCEANDGDGGPPTFSCETASNCGDYPILCASNADCAGNDVCCKASGTGGFKCVGENSCSNGALVCDPAGPTSQCPNGYHCSATPLQADGTTLPYYLCVQ